MNAVPINRVQKYFRKLERDEAVKMKQLSATPEGGEDDFHAALAREQQPPLLVRKVEPKGNMVILWWVIGVLVVSHFVRW